MNCKKGVHWLEKAALQGNRDAMFWLGITQFSDKYVKKDRVSAIRWLILAEAANHPDATEWLEKQISIAKKETVDKAQKLVEDMLNSQNK